MKEHQFDQAPANDPSRTSAQARYAQLRVDKRKKRLTIAIVVVAVVIGLAGLAGGLYYSHLNSRVGTSDEALLTSLKANANDEPFYLLLLGVDKGEERYETEGTDDSNYRADTIMLARIDPRDSKVTLVSIHRDLLVGLENGEDGKINAAFSLGGPAGMVNQVNRLTGVNVNHYAEIDFDSFMGIVDAIGGIEVTLPVDVRDPEYTELDLEAGTHVLDGHDALMLCRARHAYDEYGDGDLYRAANQRMVIGAIVKKVLASDPATMLAAVTSMADSITTDMSLDEILALASQMQDFDANTDLYTGMTPSEPQVIDEVYYEILDMSAWRRIMARVDAGLPPYESEDEDVTTGFAGVATGTTSIDDANKAKNSDEDARPATTAQTEDTTDKDKGAALDKVDKSGAIAVVGVMDGSATELAEDLAAHGFAAEPYEDPSFAFDQNLIVYGDASLEDEAEALAAYLGEGFVAVPNDGSYYLISDIVIRLSAYTS